MSKPNVDGVGGVGKQPQSTQKPSSEKAGTPAQQSIWEINEKSNKMRESGELKGCVLRASIGVSDYQKEKMAEMKALQEKNELIKDMTSVKYGQEGDMAIVVTEGGIMLDEIAEGYNINLNSLGEYNKKRLGLNDGTNEPDCKTTDDGHAIADYSQNGFEKGTVIFVQPQEVNSHGTDYLKRFVDALF